MRRVRKKAQAKWRQWKSDPQARSNTINGVWGGVDFVVSAGSVFLLIPILLNTIGQEMFGVMVIVNTIMGFSGVLSLGLGQATLKYVAEFRVKQKPALITEVIQTTFWVYCVVGLVASAIIFPLAEWMAISVFSVSSTQVVEATWAIKIGSLGFITYLLFGVGENAFRGFERFDAPVIIRSIVRLITLVAQVILALFGFGLAWLVAMQIGLMSLGTIVIMCLLKRCLVPDFSLLRGCSISMLKRVFSYGFYTSISGIFGMLRQNGDTFLVGAILGPSALALYTIPLRMLSQIHGLLSRVFGYLFPYIGKLYALGKTVQLKRHYEKATWIICIASSAMITPIGVLAHPILSIWLGEDVASATALIMQIVALRFALFPLSIVNGYFMMATGEVKIMSIVTGVNCILSLSAIGLLAYYFGIIGAAVGQLSVFIPVCINRYIIEKKLFKSANLPGTLGPIAACITPLLLVYSWGFSPEPSKLLWIGCTAVFIAVFAASISCGFYLLTSCVQRCLVKQPE